MTCDHCTRPLPEAEPLCLWIGDRHESVTVCQACAVSELAAAARGMRRLEREKLVSRLRKRKEG